MRLLPLSVSRVTLVDALLTEANDPARAPQMDVFELKADVSALLAVKLPRTGKLKLSALFAQGQPVDDHQEPVDPRDSAPLEGTSADAVRFGASDLAVMSSCIKADSGPHARSDRVPGARDLPVSCPF